MAGGENAPAAVRAWAPGRTEIAGNHVDHQDGRVIAAALDCGIEMTAQPRGDGRAFVESEGFASVELSLAETDPRLDERGTTAALVRGVVAGLRAAGVGVAGFNAQVKSTIPSGGGLSSSAAFELALIQALAVMYGGEVLAPERAARIGQAAERDWFGKPCGLMDQLAVALGGMNLIDFGAKTGGDGQSSGDGRADSEAQSAGASQAGLEASPIEVERINFDFAQTGYALVIVDTHCDHSRYTDAYAQVALDMDAVARFMGARKLREVDAERFMGRFDDVRAELGDLPALRALHFYHEMELVDRRADALRAGDMDAFLDATRRSGASSAQYLQNVSTFERGEQPAMVALALAECALAGQGAARIHGGGFGGTVQAFVPAEMAQSFIRQMDAHLGAGSCTAYRLSSRGASAARV